MLTENAHAAALLGGASGVFLVVAVLELLNARLWEARWEAREFDLRLVRHRGGASARIACALAAGAAAGAYYTSWQAAVAFAASAWLAVLSAETDLACGKVPREPAWANLAIGVALVAVSGTPAGMASAAVAFLGVGLVMGTAALLSRGKLGSGDMRMLLSLSPLAAWCGWTAVLAGIAVGSLLQFVLRPLLRRLHVFPGTNFLPFAPALAAGLLLAVVAFGQPGAPCGEWAGLLAC